MERTASLVLLTCVIVAACSGAPSKPVSDTQPGPTPTVQRTPIGALPEVDVDTVLQHTRELSSDRYDGRAPGTRGEELTVTYLIDQFRKIGLKPGNPDGTYIQKVPLVGITADGAPLVLTKGQEERRLNWKDDVVAWSKHVADSASLEHSELVFVGYGIVAPEYNWDDYKGLDVKGKTLVMLINDPPVPDPANANELDAKTFGGRAMTYYGRWTYKYEIAAEKGAVGALIIHETAPASYPFTVVQGSNLGEKFDLVTPDKNMGRAAIEGWITSDQGRSHPAVGRARFRRAEEAGRDPRFHPGAARHRRVDDDSQHAAHGRFQKCRRQARGPRTGPQGRVCRLHGALGSSRHRTRR